MATEDRSKLFLEEDTQHFNVPWCKALLSRPDFRLLPYPGRRPPPLTGKNEKFALFAETLWNSRAIRAWCPFTLSDPSNAVHPYTYCLLLALGDGLSANPGVLSGGVTAMIVDITMGMAAAKAHGAPSTANMEVEYKRPVKTPCLVLCKVHISKIEGRKCVAESMLEDGLGKVYATASATFSQPKGEEGERFAEGMMRSHNRRYPEMARPKI